MISKAPWFSMEDECCFPLEWIPRILYHSPGTGLQRWNHSLTITVGTPALICSAMQGHTNTGNGVTASLLCSAQAFIPWFSARLIILKEAPHYCIILLPKPELHHLGHCASLFWHIHAALFFATKIFSGGKKVKRNKLRDHEQQKTEHLNITGIGRRNWRCQKSHASESVYLPGMQDCLPA